MQLHALYRNYTTKSNQNCIDVCMMRWSLIDSQQQFFFLNYWRVLEFKTKMVKICRRSKKKKLHHLLFYLNLHSFDIFKISLKKCLWKHKILLCFLFRKYLKYPSQCKRFFFLFPVQKKKKNFYYDHVFNI